MEKNRADLVKWLQILFYIQLAGILLTAMSRLAPYLNISLGGNWITWVHRGLNLATVVCLFLLPALYQKAAVCETAWLLGNLLPPVLSKLIPQLGINMYMTVSSLLSWITLALSLIARFLEYNTHAAVSAQKDAKKWRILFVSSLVLSLAANIAAVLLQDPLSDMAQNGITWGITLYNLAAWLCTLVISIVYLILLARTIQNVKKEGNPYGNQRRPFC